MNKGSLPELPDFSDLHILVIGDIMIDRYIYGDKTRISPEAPVPVILEAATENRLGGAANVALNICSLGAKVTLLSIVGENGEGDLLKQILRETTTIHPQFLTIKERKTTVKTRIMANFQHVLRVDNEDISDISAAESEKLIAIYQKILQENTIDGILFQDYEKGLLTKSNISKFLELAAERQIPTFVDPKEKNFLSYVACTIFKPNIKEMVAAYGSNEDNLQILDTWLRNQLRHKETYITLGSRGIYCSNEAVSGNIYPTATINVSDVCGAGDTVISIITLCYLKNMDISAIAQIANLAGGQVCGIPGVAIVNRNKLQSQINSHF